MIRSFPVDPARRPVRPNLFLIGAPKAGTTWLAECLAQHPDVFMSDRKEPNYFCTDLPGTQRDRPLASEAEYLGYFQAGVGCKWIGEASVFYIHSPLALGRIHKFNPESRILVMLRNPVELMFSHFRFNVVRQIEPLRDFRAALAAEPQRRRGRRIPRAARNFHNLFYRELGRLSGKVRRAFDIFGRSQVHVIVNDDCAADPQGTLARLWTFLEIASPDAIDAAPRNVTGEHKYRRLDLLARSYPQAYSTMLRVLPRPMTWLMGRAARLVVAPPPDAPQQMDEALRRELAQEFQPEIQALSELIGRDLSLWNDPVPAGREDVA